MDKNIILLGGGGHCKSVIDVAENAGYNIIGILSDVKENIGQTVLGYPIIGTDDNVSDWIDKACFVVTVGQIKSNTIRITLHQRIISSGGRLATIIVPDSYVSKHACIGEGSVIMHKAVVNSNARIGRGCIINTFANIEHDTIIGDFCHISTGAMVNGSCEIGHSTFIGSGTVISNNISIAEHCIIAAGSVVRKSLTKSGLYAGNPAIKYK